MRASLPRLLVITCDLLFLAGFIMHLTGDTRGTMDGSLMGDIGLILLISSFPLTYLTSTRGKKRRRKHHHPDRFHDHLQHHHHHLHEPHSHPQP